MARLNYPCAPFDKVLSKTGRKGNLNFDHAINRDKVMSIRFHEEVDPCFSVAMLPQGGFQLHHPSKPHACNKPTPDRSGRVTLCPRNCKKSIAKAAGDALKLVVVKVLGEACM